MKIQRYLLAFLLTTLSSCGNSRTPINDLENLVDKIDTPNFYFTEENFDEITTEYAEIQDELSRYEYTDDELKEIGRLQGRYLAKITKVTVKGLKESIEGLSKQLEGGLEGFMDEMEKSDIDEDF